MAKNWDAQSRKLEAMLDEAYAKGWSDATAQVQALLEHARQPARSGAPSSTQESAPPKKFGFGRVSTGKLIPKGEADRLVEQAFRDQAPKALSPTQAKLRVMDLEGRNVSDTTVRRAIERLEKGGVLERIGSTAQWRVVTTLRAVGK